MTAAKTSDLFRHIETLQGEAEWGAFLDAGTGVNSALWGTGLKTQRWTAITGSRSHAEQVETEIGDRLRPQDRLIVGNWADSTLLEGEVFDTVLADYLLGAIEGFAPYYQSELFGRLAPHVGRRLYVIGLDPYVIGEAVTESARMVRGIGRIRDVCLMLADETPYREYPAEWTVRALTAAGFTVETARRFPNRYREKWVHGQLDMGVRRLPRIPDRRLAEALGAQIEEMREQAVLLCRQEGGLRCGADYVIACSR
jgi:hypothetical protein